MIILINTRARRVIISEGEQMTIVPLPNFMNRLAWHPDGHRQLSAEELESLGRKLLKEYPS